jgi:hypothetical protein
MDDVSMPVFFPPFFVFTRHAISFYRFTNFFLLLTALTFGKSLAPAPIVAPRNTNSYPCTSPW